MFHLILFKKTYKCAVETTYTVNLSIVIEMKSVAE